MFYIGLPDSQLTQVDQQNETQNTGNRSEKWWNKRKYSTVWQRITKEIVPRTSNSEWSKCQGKLFSEMSGLVAPWTGKKK